ncbi:Ig-like domain-containing protein [Dehalobacter sp. DCM]|uniref:Ig-like domain-containing protein n=1 Tax=Dehalobacter sp. DCM TaxID=2907827 RepID=UPI003081581B|nr:Ig-like domain-containing protein [Dehalobacter sp. DCM]
MNKNSIVIFFIMTLLLVMSPLAILAAGEEKTPLEISSATITDGEKDVPLNKEIKFVFSKNIANITVAENNKNCFSMTDSKGQPVTIEVITYDDQLERDKRNDIVIKPIELKDAEQYTITISPDVTSKSGEKLGKEVTYTFSTKGYVPSTQAGASPQASGSSAPAGNNPLVWWIVGVGAIVIIAAAIILYINHRNKNVK